MFRMGKINNYPQLVEGYSGRKKGAGRRECQLPVGCDGSRGKGQAKSLTGRRGGMFGR